MVEGVGKNAIQRPVMGDLVLGLEIVIGVVAQKYVVKHPHGVGDNFFEQHHMVKGVGKKLAKALAWRFGNTKELGMGLLRNNMSRQNSYGVAKRANKAVIWRFGVTKELGMGLLLKNTSRQIFPCCGIGISGCGRQIGTRQHPWVSRY